MTGHSVVKIGALRQTAFFALSIAFTASIVVYPDLPREIPPFRYVDGEQVFVGGPFLAFFLPIIATVISWLLARLDGHSPELARLSKGAGAKTTLFLSAFHVTMLIALIGTHLWLGRILGLMVGIFLIGARNELPLFGSNLVRQTRTRQATGIGAFWKRVHRLSGYIRVVAGITVGVASLAGAQFAQLVVVAICLEALVYVAARMLFSWQRNAAVSVVLLCCFGVGIRVEAQGLAPEKIEALPAFMDITVPKLMEQHHVAGTAVIVVYNGRIMFLRGYGKARLDSDANVDPSRTVFRVGSVTKVFTAAAAVQIAETGKLDLHRDVREYLPDIPLRYGTTTHQLLTHTAGLDERFAGAYTDSPRYLEHLSDHLRRRMPEQVFRPGAASSYSNYNYALAGLVVERLSELTYEEYIADRILSH